MVRQPKRLVTRIVVLADTHLTPAGEPYHNSDPWRITTAALARIAESAPEAVIHAGDVASRPASSRIYAAFARSVLGAVARRVADSREPISGSPRALTWHIIPGNHDDPTSMAAAMSGSRLHVHRQPTVLRVGAMRVVLLPDGSAVTPEVRRAFGEPGGLVVVTHRHLVPVGTSWIDATAHPHRRELLDLAAARRARAMASIVVWGHVHQWMPYTAAVSPGDDSEAHLLSLDSLSTRFDTSAASWALVEPNPSFAVVEWRDADRSLRITRVPVTPRTV